MTYEDFEHLTFEHKDHKVLLVTINRPEVMNATNARLHWELAKVWPVADEDPSVNVIVVTGAGDRAFSAGGDLDWVSTTAGNPDQIVSSMKEAGDIVLNMVHCQKPIISAINGVAVGAGLTVALCADISLIAEEAKLTDGHVKLGLVAGDHAVINWPMMCGMAKAKYYLLTADFIDGREAERIGLVSRCVPRAQLMDEALKVAGKLSRGSATAIRLTKRALNNWYSNAQSAFDASMALQMYSFMGPDAQEGLAAMREKRPPTFPSAGGQRPVPLTKAESRLGNPHDHV